MFIQILAILIFISALILGSKNCLFGLLGIIFVYGIFYAFTPFMIEIIKIKKGGSDDLKSQRKKKDSFGIDTDTEIYSN